MQAWAHGLGQLIAIFEQRSFNERTYGGAAAASRSCSERAQMLSEPRIRGRLGERQRQAQERVRAGDIPASLRPLPAEPEAGFTDLHRLTEERLSMDLEDDAPSAGPS